MATAAAFNVAICYHVSFLRLPVDQEIFIGDKLELMFTVCLASKPSIVRFNSIKIVLHVYTSAHVYAELRCIDVNGYECMCVCVCV